MENNANHQTAADEMGLTLARPERNIPDGRWGVDAAGRPTLTLTLTLDPTTARVSSSEKSAILYATGNIPVGVPPAIRPAMGGMDSVSLSLNVFKKLPKSSK